MPTAKQTAANRMNSQESTGPRTTQGQAASRYNAVKHGIFAHTQIMFDEKAEDLADLAAEYHEHHSPADPGERFLVDTLVSNEWRLRRLRRADAEIWQSASNAFLEKNTEAPACTSGDAFATAAPTFERLQRVVNSCERTYHRASKNSNANKPKWGRRCRLPTCLPTCLPTPDPCRRKPHPPRKPLPLQPTPRNPNNPNPVPRNWLRSVKIRKPHLPHPQNHRPPRRLPVRLPANTPR
jgi:hypothetical protein